MSVANDMSVMRLRAFLVVDDEVSSLDTLADEVSLLSETIEPVRTFEVMPTAVVGDSVMPAATGPVTGTGWLLKSPPASAPLSLLFIWSAWSTDIAASPSLSTAGTSAAIWAISVTIPTGLGNNVAVPLLIIAGAAVATSSTAGVKSWIGTLRRASIGSLQLSSLQQLKHSVLGLSKNI